MRRAALVTVVAVVAVLFAAVAPTAGADSAGRLRELTLHSDGVGDVDVRILLPAGYDDPARAATRYPVLYLLHGMSGDETDWTDLTDVEELTAPHDLIVVMPDGGRDGFYSDWLVGPQWETFHIGELIPFVDENYRTVATRQARAIAGLSMGGYGAMVYAARHPDLFVAAASFSGAVDIADLGAVEGIGLELLLNAGPRWGPFVTNEINWRDHNPPDLGTNLRGMRVDIFAGNGVPRAGDNALSTPVEVATYTMSTALHVRLRADGVAHGWHDYGPGTHEWHYWQADLHQWLPIVLATFAAPPSRPEAFDYRTARPSFSVDDWSFTVERAAREFVDLTGVSVSGLTLRGSGAVDVVTPPSYEPGATYEVAVRQASGPVSPGDIVGPLSSVKARAPRAQAGQPVRIVAGDDGRLRIRVDLGPTHTADQYTLAGDAEAATQALSYWGVREVTIAPVDSTAAVAVAVAEPSAENAPQQLPATGSNAPATAAGLLVGLALFARVVRRA